MNKVTWVILLAVVVLGIVGSYWYEREPSASITGSQASTTTGAGIANPASVNCVHLGGELEIAEDSTGGAIGYCHLKDGRVCEEWALFRDGTCTSKQ